MSTLYQDKLIALTDDAITFRRYYFPFGDRTLPLAQIERIDVASPSVRDGSWRLWGTSDFQTWFPLDSKRPSRDRIFTVHLRNARRRIGFTVENSAQVTQLLQAKGLLPAR